MNSHEIFRVFKYAAEVAGCNPEELTLVLDNGWTITRTVGTGAGLHITDADGIDLKKPAEQLKALFDAVAFDPVAFLTATPKDRVAQLLASCAGTLDERVVVDLFARIGQPCPKRTGVEDPLEWLARCRQALYDRRTGANRLLAAAKATVQRLAEAAHQADEAEDWPAKATALDTKLYEVVQAHSLELATLQARHHEAIQALREQQQREIDTRKAAHAGEREGVGAELRHARAQAQLVQQLAGARAEHARADAETLTLFTEVDGLTAGVESLDALRGALLQKLPVPGLAVVEGEIALDGIPFDQLAESERIVLALKLTAARCGALRVVLLDGVERLSAEARKSLQSHAKKLKLQLVGARVVDEGPLHVVQQ